MSLACWVLMVPAKAPMPPVLFAMALRIVLGELAPFRTLLMFSAGMAEWHDAQLAA